MMASSREIINQATDEIAEKLKGNLEAIVLVGSFARGEAIEGVSDIELWAVVKDIAKVSRLKAAGGDISLGFTTRKHLEKLKPYIYTLEAKRFGKVLWGDKDILSLIPDYNFEDIAPYDGFVLLNNRIVEQLILYGKIESNEPVVKYQLSKGYAQLVNALLVFNKRYRSLYSEKLEEFQRLSLSGLNGFKDEVSAAFASMKVDSTRIVEKQEALTTWLGLRERFKEVFIEAQKFSPSLAQKAKDWLKAMRKNPFSPRPSHLIYKRASKLYFSEEYNDCKKRQEVIRDWERFVK